MDNFINKTNGKTKNMVEGCCLEIVGIQGSRRQAKDREEWRNLLRDARAQKGL